MVSRRLQTKLDAASFAANAGSECCQMLKCMVRKTCKGGEELLEEIGIYERRGDSGGSKATLRSSFKLSLLHTRPLVTSDTSD